jgi:hypothetical protein
MIFVLDVCIRLVGYLFHDQQIQEAVLNWNMSSLSPSLLNMSSLEQITIKFADNLKQIFYSGEGDALTRDGIINFPQLTKLSLSSCSFFGPKSFTAQLPSLQVLTKPLNVTKNWVICCHSYKYVLSVSPLIFYF